MSWLAALFALLKALPLALQIYIMRELRRERDDQDADEREIARLRDTGLESDALLADRLRERLVRSVGIVSRIESALAAPDPAPPGGTGGADQERPVLPG